MNEPGNYWPIIIAQRAVVLVQSSLLKSHRYLRLHWNFLVGLRHEEEIDFCWFCVDYYHRSSMESIYKRRTLFVWPRVRARVVGDSSRLDMRCDHRVGRSTNETSSGNKWNMSISLVRINSKARHHHHHRPKSMNLYFGLLSSGDEVIRTFCN